ncbi:hypothetical protein HY384_03500, partial [Candidatus Daviesbacteria bacterium]|nr:hypothetical protein [Candidatus Daviesbacteria bacterium]
MEEIQDKLKELKDRFEKILASLDRDKLRTEIRELEAQTMKEGFWNNPKESSSQGRGSLQAAVISRKLSDKQKTLNTLNELETRIQNALEISEEPTMQEDLQKETTEITKEL